MLVIMFLALCMEEGGVKYGATGIYQPLRRSEVTVSPGGDVYIADFKEGRVLHYRPDGQRLADIGRRGEGPGEFSNPSALFCDNGKLYVIDMGSGSFSIFNADGSFFKKSAMPGNGLEISRIENGWLSSDWRFSMNPEAPVTLRIWDDALETSSAVAEWPRLEENNMIQLRAGGGSKPKVPFRPVRDGYQLAVTPDRKWAFVSHPGVFKISVIDVAAKKVAGTIDRDLKGIPFNEEWGKVRFDKFMEGNKRMAMRVQFEADFPDYFPVVRNLYANAEGTVVVETWSADPDRIKKAYAFKADGGDAKLPYRPENETRIMASSGGQVYISLFDTGEDEAALLLVPKRAVDKLISEHPIEYEGPEERLIMRGH